MNAVNFTNDLSYYYNVISSGNKINSAGDDASGLAVSEKLKAQSSGYDAGVNNAADAMNMINVADGALSSIQDSLMRIRDLSVQAANGIYGDTELSIFQDEINQLKDFIGGVIEGTEFNKNKLLDGSSDGTELAYNPDGTGTSLRMSDLSEALSSLEDYDVTGRFDISVIDFAINTVSQYRGGLGAKSNALDSVIDFNRNGAYNSTSAGSRIADTDMADAITELKKNQTLQDMRLAMLKKKQEEEANSLDKLLNNTFLFR